MKQRLLVLILAADCIVLGTVSFFVSAGQDDKPPKINIKKMEISYKEGNDYSSLLEGVSAEDDRDGDLSDEIFIDRIIPLEDGNAVVYYGVMDSNKNVGTASRKIKYTADTTSEAADGENDDGEADVEGEEKNTQEDENAASDTEELKPDGERPVIALNAEADQIKAGGEFDALHYVKGVADDKDDQNTLYRHIHVDGSYDINTKGTYELRFYVNDSEGNTSDVKTFRLTIQ